MDLELWIIDRESMGHLTCTPLAMASLASQRPAHSHQRPLELAKVDVTACDELLGKDSEET